MRRERLVDQGDNCRREFLPFVSKGKANKFQGTLPCKFEKSSRQGLVVRRTEGATGLQGKRLAVLGPQSVIQIPTEFPRRVTQIGALLAPRC
jgi:hypothetical protein